MIELSIVLPCYNESENLNQIFESIETILSSKDDLEIILVDNGSTDNSLEIMNGFKSAFESKRLQIVSIKKNIGYGHGIMTGLKNAKGKVLAWTHADLQTDLNDVTDAYDLFMSKGNIDQYILKGKRVNRSFLDSTFTAGMSFISSLFLRQRLSDVNAQPKMFKKDFLEFLNKAPDDFSLDLYFLYQSRKNKFKLIEYPVQFNKRKHGVSKGGGSLCGKVKLTFRTLKYILNLKRNLN